MNSSYGGDRLIWLPDAPPTSRVGYNGAPQTIALMARSALDDANHFETRKLAEAVCEGLDSKDYTSEYLALYYFLLQHTRYMRDPRRTELVRAPHVISKQILQGFRPSIDCDDATTWLGAAILAVGGQAEFCTVAFQHMFFDGQRQYSHVFPRAIEPRTKTKIVLDPVAADKTPQMLRRIKAMEPWPLTT